MRLPTRGEVEARDRRARRARGGAARRRSARACRGSRGARARRRRTASPARARSTAGARSRRSARRACSNRWWASITSSPLFISVAESIVIFAPIDHVGCASACSGVTPSSSLARAAAERPARGRDREPLDRARAVRALGRRSAARAPRARSRPAGSARRSPRRAPSRARRRRRATPCWRAPGRSPRRARRPSARGPAEPTIALRTRSAPDSDDQLDTPLRAREHLALGPGARPRCAAACGVGQRDPPDAVAPAPARRRAPRRSAPRGRRPRGPPVRATTSSACTPIEPVAPRITIASCHRRAQDREPDVVAGDDREQRRVEAVERAAVRAEHAAGVLHPRLALDVALEEVADRRGDRHADAEQERVALRQPRPGRGSRTRRPRRRRRCRSRAPRRSCSARSTAPAAAGRSCARRGRRRCRRRTCRRARR